MNIKKSFEHAHWDMKIYWISPDTSRNSTTVITLMTGFIFTCEERSVINDTSTCDLTMDFDVSLFEWPESASELQAKLFEFKLAILFFKIENIRLLVHKCGFSGLVLNHQLLKDLERIDKIRSNLFIWGGFFWLQVL